MTQMYATGSANIQAGTIDLLVSTPIEPSLNIYVQGIFVGATLMLIGIVIMNLAYLIEERLRTKWKL